MKKLWLFGLLSGDKGDYIDMWMIKIIIETNQIDIQKPSLSLKSGFFLLVYWFVTLTLTDKHGTKNL